MSHLVQGNRNDHHFWVDLWLRLALRDRLVRQENAPWAAAVDRVIRQSLGRKVDTRIGELVGRDEAKL